jgi:excisionase family DNA binding protein
MYYTPEEIAERLKVTRRSVYTWLLSGQLRGLRAGDKWRVAEPDLTAFLEGDRPAPGSTKAAKPKNPKNRK